MKRILLILLALCLAGCGGSSDLNQVSGQVGGAGAGGANFRLDGVWGGFFPDHAAGSDRGVEIQFARTEREAFVLRADGVHVFEMESQQNGADVSIELTSLQNPQDRSTFVGRFTSPTSITGQYTNVSQNENFALELNRHPNSDAVKVPLEISGVQPQVAAQGANQYEAIKITGVNQSGAPYEWIIEPGYPGGFQATIPGGAIEGQMYFTQMNWFGNWTGIELYGNSATQQSVCLGVLWLDRYDWLGVTYNPPLSLPLSGDKSYWYTDYDNNNYDDLGAFTFQIVPSTRQEQGFYIAPYTPSNPTILYTSIIDETQYLVTRVIAAYMRDYTI